MKDWKSVIKNVGRACRKYPVLVFLLYGLLIGVFSYWADGRMETLRLILNLPGTEIGMRIRNYYRLSKDS